jgi:hypothetical protein
MTRKLKDIYIEVRRLIEPYDQQLGADPDIKEGARKSELRATALDFWRCIISFGINYVPPVSTRSQTFVTGQPHQNHPKPRVQSKKTNPKRPSSSRGVTYFSLIDLIVNPAGHLPEILMLDSIQQ